MTRNIRYNRFKSIERISERRKKRELLNTPPEHPCPHCGRTAWGADEGEGAWSCYVCGAREFRDMEPKMV